MKIEKEEKWSQPSTVVASDPENHMYLVNTPHGTLRRNRRHLQQLLLPPIQPHTDPPDEDLADLNVPYNLPETEPGPSDPPIHPVTRLSRDISIPKPLRFRDED